MRKNAAPRSRKRRRLLLQLSDGRSSAGRLYMAKELGICLGAISEDQDRLNKPMLSAVAVQVDGEPGSGFYTMAHTLKKVQWKRRPYGTASLLGG